SQIKRKALELNEDLAIFLDNKGFSGIYIEPLIGFVKDDLAILNVILTNEDLFIDELFNRMIRGQRRIDELTVAKIARLLSYYSADCSVV
ncbi:MAG: NERD domain-containing protein, partial [Methanobrevibacter sp.]|nr:NERD domain-containing protein [Methanobrevibacter sp.]